MKIILTAILVILSAIFILNPQRFGEQISLQKTIAQNSLEKVETSLSNNLIMFATLSAIKGAMAVVEGSTVGVTLIANAQVDIGDIIQPAYDYLDFIWNLFLYAIFILTAYKVILSSGLLAIGLPLLGIGGLLFATSMNANSDRSESFLGWGRLFLWYGVIIAYGIPVALFLSAQVEQAYTQPLKNSAWVKVEVAQKEITLAKDTLVDGAWSSILSPQKAMQDVAIRIASASKDLLESGLYYISIVLFELLLIPFATLVIFSMGLGKGIKSFSGKIGKR